MIYFFRRRVVVEGLLALRALHELMPVFGLRDDRAVKANTVRFGPPVGRRRLRGPLYVARVGSEKMLQHIPSVQVRTAAQALQFAGQFSFFGGEV